MSVTGTNQAKKGIFGDLTMAELASTPLSRWVSTTFLTPMVLGTNNTKNTATGTNQTKN